MWPSETVRADARPMYCTARELIERARAQLPEDFDGQECPTEEVREGYTKSHQHQCESSKKSRCFAMAWDSRRKRLNYNLVRANHSLGKSKHHGELPEITPRPSALTADGLPIDASRIDGAKSFWMWQMWRIYLHHEAALNQFADRLPLRIVADAFLKSLEELFTILKPVLIMHKLHVWVEELLEYI